MHTELDLILVIMITKNLNYEEEMTKKIQCKYGSTAHLTSRSMQCTFNEKNLLLVAVCDSEATEGEKDSVYSDILAAVTI